MLWFFCWRKTLLFLWRNRIQRHFYICMLWIFWSTVNCSLPSSFCLPHRRHSYINIPPACTPPAKCSALPGILSSGGNLCVMLQRFATRKHPSLVFYKSTNWGHGVLFWNVVIAREKINCLMSSYWEIIREREEREEKHSIALSYWHNFGAERTLLKALLLSTAYPWQRRFALRNLCLRNVNTFRWVSWELLKCVICSLLCSTIQLQLPVFPSVSCACRQQCMVQSYLSSGCSPSSLLWIATWVKILCT